MCFILFINVNRWDYELAILLLACAEHVATVHCSIQCRLISIFSQLQPGVFGFGYYSIFICMRLFTGSFRRTLAFVETWKENPPSAFSFDSLFIAVFVGRMKTDANMSAAWTVRRWKTQYQWNESDQLIQFHRPVQPCSIQFALLFLTNSIANKLVGGGVFSLCLSSSWRVQEREAPDFYSLHLWVYFLVFFSKFRNKFAMQMDFTYSKISPIGEATEANNNSNCVEAEIEYGNRWNWDELASISRLNYHLLKMNRHQFESIEQKNCIKSSGPVWNSGFILHSM